MYDVSACCSARRLRARCSSAMSPPTADVVSCTLWSRTLVLAQRLCAHADLVLQRVLLGVERVHAMLERLERLHRLACRHLELQQRLVPLLDASHVWIFLDLQLVEIDVVQHAARLLLLLKLRLGLQDVRLDRRVPARVQRCFPYRE